MQAGGAINQDPNNGGHTDATLTNVILWGDSSSNGNEISSGPGGTATITYAVIQGGCPAGATCSGTILNADPLLGALASNGGLTQTMALQDGSPAIDAGTNSGCPPH